MTAKAVLALLSILCGGQSVSTAQVRLSLPSFIIESGLVTVLDASTLMPITPSTRERRAEEVVPGFPIENDVATIPLGTHDVVVFLTSLELVRKRDGMRVHALAASGEPLRLKTAELGSRAEIRLPYTTIVAIEVKDSRIEGPGETGVSLLTDDATVEMKTDHSGRAAILVGPGEYGVGLTGKSGYVRVDISRHNPSDHLIVSLTKPE